MGSPGLDKKGAFTELLGDKLHTISREKLSRQIDSMKQEKLSLELSHVFSITVLFIFLLEFCSL